MELEKRIESLENQRMQTEAQIKREMMELQFQYDLQLAQVDVQEVQRKEQYIEDRKDKRTKIQATQQSKMISQRQNDTLPSDFELPDNLGELGIGQIAQ